MRIPRLFITLVAALALALASLSAAPAAEASDDRTLSPYFHVDSLDADGDALPLRSTRVEALVAGVIADVTVTQTYANTGSVPLEARYVFPGSTRAAVHGLTLVVGERRIRAKIQKKEEARATYETAKREGKTASLLEQHRPNVFQMAVANILPGDTVQVELRYTELLAPTDGVYEFVYPGVVGPRYSNRPAASAPDDARWVANPYLPEGAPDRAAFALSLRLATGVPIQEAACRTHSTRIDYRSPAEARIEIDPAEASPGDRDFILRYRLAGEALASGLLVSAEPDARGDRYFLAMVQPPARPKPADIPARDFVFIVDVSGSMGGFPLDTAKQLLRDLLPALRPRDTFNLVLFAGDSAVLSPTPLPASAAHLDSALAFLGQRHGGGGTELLPALQKALALPRPGENTSRIVAVLSDGYVAVEAEAYALVRHSLGQGNVFAFGIGASVNRELIESLARAGQGEPFVVTDPGLAASEAARFAAMISTPVLTGLSARVEGAEARELEPASLPDVFAARPVVVFGKYSGDAASARLRLGGATGLGRSARPFLAELPFARATAVPAETLARLWARSRIAALSDQLALREDPETVSAITRLGLEHELLTRFTSFVAVDEIVRRAPEDPLATVDQPLPLPQGVSNQAVGGSAPIVPEPAATGLLLTAAALALVLLRRRPRAAPARG